MGNEGATNQFVRARISRWSFHDVTFCFFVGQRNGWDHVCTKINAENGDSAQGQGNVADDEEQKRRDLRDVGGQCVCDGLLQVVKNEAAWNRSKENN